MKFEAWSTKQGHSTVYRIAGKFGGELNLALWRIDQPTAKLKIRQYLYKYVRKINNGCGRSRASARARAHCRSQLFFDVHARRCKILLLLTMSLYRLFTKAGMASLTDKEIENANTSTYVWIERARVGVAI